MKEVWKLEVSATLDVENLSGQTSKLGLSKSNKNRGKVRFPCQTTIIKSFVQYYVKVEGKGTSFVTSGTFSFQNL
ncbi:uncharacterized protein G2W53_038166 [Senna tora]|uniref:Uncharacterized protein n=1 Tax=Senna tora TaxID=362788 RepID=A0A834SKI4_9FABA|nr:uncharacterized protein G2W53_038166 [Senna tora]